MILILYLDVFSLSLPSFCGQTLYKLSSGYGLLRSPLLLYLLFCVGLFPCSLHITLHIFCVVWRKCENLSKRIWLGYQGIQSLCQYVKLQTKSLKEIAASFCRRQTKKAFTIHTEHMSCLEATCNDTLFSLIREGQKIVQRNHILILFLCTCCDSE